MREIMFEQPDHAAAFSRFTVNPSDTAAVSLKLTKIS